MAEHLFCIQEALGPLLALSAKRSEVKSVGKRPFSAWESGQPLPFSMNSVELGDPGTW